MISYLELIEKEVININNGENIGKFTDAEIDTKSGKVTALYISEGKKLLGFFSKGNERAILWSKIVKVGLDVVIVDCSTESLLEE